MTTTPNITPHDEIDAHRLIPIHEVRDQGKLASLVDAMVELGWQGPPLPVWDGDGMLGWAGSHRIQAARQAEIDVPVYYLDDTAGYPDLGDDDDRLAHYKDVASDDEDGIALLEWEAYK